MERSKTQVVAAEARAPVSQPDAFVEDEETAEEEDETSAPEAQETEGGRRRSRRRRRRRDEGRPVPAGEAPAHFAQPEPESASNGERAEFDERRADGDDAEPADDTVAAFQPGPEAQGPDGDMSRRRRRRGRRGGRRRRRGGERPAANLAGDEAPDAAAGPVEPDAYTGGPITDWTDETDADDAAVTQVQTPADAPAESPIGEDRDVRPSDASAAEPQGNGHHDVHRDPGEDLPSSRSAEPAPEVVDDAGPTAAESNGNGASPATTEAEADAEPEAAQPQPAGPPRRGWWKRLIE
jgi:ribonuclease E